METIIIRLNKNESQTFKEYAALNDVPLSTLFKKYWKKKWKMSSI